MKKFISYIIFFFTFFSIFSYDMAFCNDGVISDILNIQYGAQENKLNNIKLNTFSYKTTSYKTAYLKIKGDDTKLRTIILNKIKNNDFTYYNGIDIINSYSTFVYNVNKLFKLFSLKESNPNDSSINSKITNAYYTLQTSYKRVQYLVYK